MTNHHTQLYTAMSGPDKWITSITLQYPPGGGKKKGSEISKVTFSGNPNPKFPTSLGPRHRTMRPSAPGMHPLLAVHRPDTADTHSSGLVCDALLLHFIQAIKPCVPQIRLSTPGGVAPWIPADYPRPWQPTLHISTKRRMGRG